MEKLLKDVRPIGMTSLSNSSHIKHMTEGPMHTIIALAAFNYLILAHQYTLVEL
jgi:hypothetical protein